MKLYSAAWLILLAGTLFCACATGPDIPSYVEIGEITFSTSSPSQGSSSSRITDAWIFTETDLLGGFEMPTTIPVLAEGEVLLYIGAGVWKNGMQSTRVTYPFYAYDTIYADLNAAQVTRLNPSVKYRNNLQFRINEDFEGNHAFSEDLDVNPDTRIVITTEDVYEGNRSGMIHLTQADDNIFFELGTVEKFTDLPINGQPVYLEMNYKNDIEFRIGFIHYEGLNITRRYKVTLVPRQEWNKVYISLEDELSEMGAGLVQIAISGLLPEDVEEGRIWLDNIKLIHF